jgi:hypothetical protein
MVHPRISLRSGYSLTAGKIATSVAVIETCCGARSSEFIHSDIEGRHEVE